MKHLLKFCAMALVPFAANAAGTYYTGNYQSPQTRYNTKSYTSGTMTQNTTYNRTYSRPVNSGYNNYSYSSTRPTVGLSASQQARFSQDGRAPQQSRNAASSSATEKGFWVDAGVSYETAKWQFEMKNSGSILHYDDISWYVLGLNAGYAFDMGSVGGEIQAGFKYGFQGGESSMIDDDITNGGYLVTEFVKTDADGNVTEVVGSQVGHALSIGASDGGNMYGFNAGFGITDMFKIGNLKFTPSIGYRYLKYELETKNNYGLSVDSYQCFTDASGETQCDPILIFYENIDGDAPQLSQRDDLSNFLDVPSGVTIVDTAGTYYFEQPGASHSYDVSWAGPYFALDMDYIINQNNAIMGRLEFGLPSYKATGDQPYRHDWQHPKSVEDSAGIGSAFHFGAGMNWVTAISGAVSLSLGVTYDYYTVGDADAKTYINSDYYYGLYDAYLEKWGGNEEEMLAQDKFAAALAQNIADIEDQCPGWVCKSDGEIESFYKSLGVRVGIFAKF